MKKKLQQRYYSCFFTGHRVLNDGESRQRIYKILVKECEKLINERGVDVFICGGARGFDTMGAKAVIYLKNKYPDIKLKLYIPCYKHFIRWSYKDKMMWRYITAYADEAIYITDSEYEEGCMQKRNHRMADDAHYCIAYCIKYGSGTGSTIKYAETKSCEINNIADLV